MKELIIGFVVGFFTALLISLHLCRAPLVDENEQPIRK